ncbi:putative disease resistance RPP13-like protein 3 [Beta vulgaris subsp. vulgaris]|uniref:putative disease resistance RPP13-like protein 3 n=1 Tax=Beta vulgaris subsp. vulgaris TaxID=3555 RepID=UPI002548489A|nr:putative disease resistance RPP13-like protein 3 [Beta vulgaris subsp. vulgaris]
MADTMLSFALEKLSTLITAEAELLGSLSDDVRKLQYELDSIKEVLKDAEKKAEVDNGIRVWLTQLRESAYHIEDVIDQYFLLKQQQQQQQQHLLQSDYNKSLKNQFLLMINKISKRVKSAFACITQLKPKHELSSEMKKILADINWQDPRVSSLFKDESELFDFTRKKTQIFSWLNLEQQNDQDRTKIQGPRAVIAVVGMGGLGKTTLVRKVYEDKKVKEGFSVYAWVTVSQSYRWRDLLNSIFKQVHAEPSLQLDTSDEHTIISKLRIHLEEKRYIVVFDDVWDSKLWEYVENALPNNKRCSAIMITTREVDVGGAWNDPSSGHHLYKLEPLSAKASWDLFCHKTFGNTNCPPELENLSWEMVGKCEGLPLALVAIAGLLSTKEKIISSGLSCTIVLVLRWK